MGLLSTEVEVNISRNNANYYENLGYEVLKRLNKKGQLVYNLPQKIFVKIRDLPLYSTQMVDVQCDCCKKEYKVKYFNYVKSQKLHKGTVYCVHCIQKIFKKNMSLEEHDRRKIYPNYNTFVVKVLKRDNYTCQCCGKKDSLEVHHLDGYDWCVEKRLDETNGITLCFNCHKNFHSKYGRGNNTKEQFEKWFGQAEIELKEFNGELTSTRKVYCYEEDRIYNSALEFITNNHIKTTNSIYKICNRLSGYNTCNRKHLFWYDEYVNMSQKDILNIVNAPRNSRNKKVICLTTNKIYQSICDGAKNEKASRTSITRCCCGEAKHVHTKDGKITNWMYYEDYLLLEGE